MALRSRPEDRGPLVSGDTLPLRSFPEKRCSQMLSSCYHALAGEASKVLAQHLSQPIKNNGAVHVSQSRHPHRFHGSAAQNTCQPHRQRTHSPFGGNNPTLPARFGVFAMSPAANWTKVNFFSVMCPSRQRNITSAASRSSGSLSTTRSASNPACKGRITVPSGLQRIYCDVFVMRPDRTAWLVTHRCTSCVASE